MELSLFIEEKLVVEQELVCAICRNVMLKPTMVLACQHSFCELCLAVWIATKPDCPTCRASVDRTAPDRRAARQISKLQVRCKAPTCSVTGELGLEDNDFWKRHDPVCAEKRCLFCWGRFPDLKQHSAICPQSYDYCCFKKLGCTDFIKRCNMQKHLHENLYAHHVMMLKYLSASDPELAKLEGTLPGDGSRKAFEEELGFRCTHCHSSRFSFASRFMCLICADVDVCEACFKDRYAADGEHIMLQFVSSSSTLGFREFLKRQEFELIELQEATSKIVEQVKLAAGNDDPRGQRINEFKMTQFDSFVRAEACVDSFFMLIYTDLLQEHYQGRNWELLSKLWSSTLMSTNVVLKLLGLLWIIDWNKLPMTDFSQESKRVEWAIELIWGFYI